MERVWLSYTVNDQNSLAGMLGGICSLYVLPPSRGLPLASTNAPAYASPDHFLRHRRCDTGGIEEEKVFRVEIERAVLLELITAADEWRNPCTVRVEIGVLDPRLIGKSAGCGIAHRRCLGKYLFQASVGR